MCLTFCSVGNEKVEKLLNNFSCGGSLEQIYIGDVTDFEIKHIFFPEPSKKNKKILKNFLDHCLDMVNESVWGNRNKECSGILSSFGSFDKNKAIRGGVGRIYSKKNEIFETSKVETRVRIDKRRNLYDLQMKVLVEEKMKKNPFESYFVIDKILSDYKQNEKYINLFWGDIIRPITKVEELHDFVNCSTYDVFVNNGVLNKRQATAEEVFCHVHENYGKKILSSFGSNLLFYEFYCVSKEVPEAKQDKNYYIFIVDLDSNEFEMFENWPTKKVKNKRSIYANSWLLRKRKNL